MPRDFIPQGEKPTADEQRRIDNASAAFRGGVKQDFIPPLGWISPDRKTRDQQIQEAMDAADKRTAKAVYAQYDDAVRRLQFLDPSDAIETMRLLPADVRTLWLVAEDATLNRAAIMDAYGKIGDVERKQYNPRFKAQDEEGKTEAQVPAKTPGRKASTVKVPA